MMSKNNLYVAMACAILAFTGCTEDDMPGGNTKPAHPGEEIIFGGTLDSKNTRTVYGDKHVDDKYTEVKWVAGDGVGIYCAEALYQDADGNYIMQEGSTTEKPLYQKYCEYTVTNGVTDLGSVIDGEKQDTHSTGLKPSGEGYGLRWGSNGTHEFYAVYPSKTQLTGKDDEAANTLKLEENKLTAQLPNMQGATDANYSTYIKDDNGNVTYYPAMRYAYMTAYKPSVPVSNLSLTFEPIVTAVEITLQNNTKIMQNGTATNQDLEVEMITLSHPTAALCGTFTADLETKMVTNANADASLKTVSVPTKMKSADGGTEKGNLLLAHGNTVTVTAFMALDNNANLDQIKVSILANGQLKTATLESTTDGVQIVQAKKKNFISTVNIGYTTEVAVDYSHWVTDLKAVAPNTTLGVLSIPGAGGATSSAFDATATSGLTNELVEASREQTLSIDELWNQGVRCFEVTVSNASNFGNQYVFCNYIKTTQTLNQVVQAISNKISTSNEFGMLIIGYQEENAGDSRDAGDDGFGGRFRAWCNGTGDSHLPQLLDDNVSLEAYSHNMTVKQAENKLFIIGRPVTIGHDPGWFTGVADNDGNNTANNFETNAKVTNILGWGANPDQWYARGYGQLVTQTPDRYNFSFDNSFVKTSGVDDRPYQASKTAYSKMASAVSKTSDFTYKCTTQADQAYNSCTSTAWVQDWKRVAPNEAIRTQYGIAETTKSAVASKGSYWNTDAQTYYYSWAPTDGEKWTDVQETLNMALAATSGHSIYINSLCGFFVDGDIALSYQPRPVYQRYGKNNYGFITGNYQSTSVRIYLDDIYRNNEDVDLDASSNAVGTNKYGPYHVSGGYQGNIAAYADWINTKFYNLLLQKQANGELTGKSAGIVMMDRVSDNAEENEAGYYIPRIIISMNFSGVESTTLEAKTSVLEGGDPVLGRKNFKVTWDN